MQLLDTEGGRNKSKDLCPRGICQTVLGGALWGLSKSVPLEGFMGVGQPSCGFSTRTCLLALVFVWLLFACAQTTL